MMTCEVEGSDEEVEEEEDNVGKTWLYLQEMPPLTTYSLSFCHQTSIYGISLALSRLCPPLIVILTVPLSPLCIIFSLLHPLHFHLFPFLSLPSMPSPATSTSPSPPPLTFSLTFFPHLSPSLSFFHSLPPFPATPIPFPPRPLQPFPSHPPGYCNNRTAHRPVIALKYIN